MTTMILCAVDGSDHSDRALSTAIGFAAKLGVDLALCVVNEQYGTSPHGPQALVRTQAEVDKILADAKTVATARNVAVASAQVIVDRGVAAGILQHAADLGADHIVIGTGDKHGLDRWVLGSVAKDVATRAPCTVTIAR